MKNVDVMTRNELWAEEEELAAAMSDGNRATAIRARRLKEVRAALKDISEAARAVGSVQNFRGAS